MSNKTLAYKLLLVLALPLPGGRACDVAPADLFALLDFHREMVRMTPKSLPGYSGIVKSTPPSLEVQTVECVAVGPLRFIHPPESRSVFILDVKRAFDRWGVRDAGKSTWRKATQSYIRDYLLTSSSTLAQIYGRPAFSDVERSLLGSAQTEALPPSVQITIPQREELRRLGSTEISPATRGLISRLILQAIVSYMAQERLTGWLDNLDVGRLTLNDSYVSVRVVVNMGSNPPESVPLKIAVNPRMAPYVGLVYPASR